PVRVVLRSGCYLTHDHGDYERLSPFGSRLPEWEPLRQAMEVWGLVHSRPEPDLAIVGFGKRDVSYDLGLPRPLHVRSRDGRRRAATGRGDLPPGGPVGEGIQGRRSARAPRRRALSAAVRTVMRRWPGTCAWSALLRTTIPRDSSQAATDRASAGEPQPVSRKLVSEGWTTAPTS